ncbi:MAG: HNH endonuclease [Synechococcaceae cyanobacterium RM1_1_27]|nr:HNH endonuclease [Synechococcaceae cyanobacterium RM1_1_27]
MPMNRSRYPANWDEIATAIKTAADWRCAGCGQVCRPAGRSFAQFAEELIGSGQDIDLDHPNKYLLTVAHLNHIPEDCRPENLRALCAPCHCRYDLKAMPLKVKLKREHNGQQTLDFDAVSAVSTGSVAIINL